MLMVCLQGTIYVFARDILSLYVGPEIADAGTHVLRIFAVTAVIAAPSIAVNQYLLGTGATMWIAATAAASGILTLLLSCVLIPKYGISGAAWSDLGAILLSRPLSHWAIWRYHLRSLVRGTHLVVALYGASFAGVPATLLLSWARNQTSWRMNWPGLISGSALIIMLLAGLLLLVDRWQPAGQRRGDDVLDLARRLGTRFRHQKHV
jgi:O-antigen/teichoic acid export membrane protein